MNGATRLRMPRVPCVGTADTTMSAACNASFEVGRDLEPVRETHVGQIHGVGAARAHVRDERRHRAPRARRRAPVAPDGLRASSPIRRRRSQRCDRYQAPPTRRCEFRMVRCERDIRRSLRRQPALEQCNRVHRRGSETDLAHAVEQRTPTEGPRPRGRGASVRCGLYGRSSVATPARVSRSLTCALDRHRADHGRPSARPRPPVEALSAETCPTPAMVRSKGSSASGWAEHITDRVGLLLVDVSNEANGHVQAIGRRPTKCGTAVRVRTPPSPEDGR